MESLEKLDRNRLDLTKKIFFEFKKYMKDINDCSSERLKKILKKIVTDISADKDIQDFIIYAKSGESRDKPMEFEPYIVNIPQEVSQARYSVAIQQQPQKTTGDNVLKTVKALYKFEGKNEGELSLNEGDIIKVYQMDEGWWIGESKGVKGYFPSNFVSDA